MTPGALAAALLALSVAGSHPSHTSTAELVARGDSVYVAIRIFADDLAGTGDLRAYVAQRFGITDAHGRAVPLAWAGTKPRGDLLVVHLRGHILEGLRSATVRHDILLERFTDQINLVRATYQGRAATLVFVPGDPPKALP